MKSLQNLIIEKIKKTKIAGKKNNRQLTEFRDQVLVAINGSIQENEDQELVNEELEVLCQFFQQRTNPEYWTRLLTDYGCPYVAASYILQSAFTSSKSATYSSISLQVAMALNRIEFKGSIKQVSWAESIAEKSIEAITKVWEEKGKFALPIDAGWWIQNKDDIAGALMELD